MDKRTDGFNKEKFQEISHKEADRILDEHKKLQVQKQKEIAEAQAAIFFSEYPELEQHGDYLRRANLARKETMSGEGAYNYILNSGTAAIKILKEPMSLSDNQFLSSSFVKLRHEARMNEQFWEKRKELIQLGELPENFTIPDIYRLPTKEHPFYETEYIQGQNLYSKYLIKEMGSPEAAAKMTDKQVEDVYIRSVVIGWMQEILQDPDFASFENVLGELIELAPEVPVRYLESRYRELRTKQTKEYQPHILSLRPSIKKLDLSGVVAPDQKNLILDANDLFKKRGVSHRDRHAKNIMISNDQKIYAIDYAASAFVNTEDSEGNILFSNDRLLYDHNQLPIEQINDKFSKNVRFGRTYESILLTLLNEELGNKKLKKTDWKTLIDSPRWMFLLKYRGKDGSKANVLENVMLKYSNMLTILNETIKTGKKKK